MDQMSRIESDLARHARSIRRSQQAFALFASAALVIGLVNLVAVASKLGTKDVRVAGAQAAAGAAPRAGSTAPAAALPHKVGVGLKEFKVLPGAAQAAAGKVSFDVRNIGTVKHEFVVIKTTKPAADLLKGTSADEAGKVGEIGGLNPGRAKTLSLNLKPGHYALICNQPGHYKAGQHADFTVK
jgi:uncharacterized cupredoxin-like copper-binding protein